MELCSQRPAGQILILFLLPPFKHYLLIKFVHPFLEPFLLPRLTVNFEEALHRHVWLSKGRQGEFGKSSEH